MKKILFLFLILFSFQALAGIVYPKVSSPKGLAPNLNLSEYQTPAVIKINEAKQAYWEEDYPKACELWHEALNLGPFHPEGIWHDIALCSEKQEKYAEAAEALTHAIEVTPNPDFYAFRGDMYFKDKKTDLAQKDFETFFAAKNLDPNKAYRTLARLFWREGNYEQSLNYAEKGIPKLTGLNRSILIVNKAGALGFLKRPDEALSFLDEHKDSFAELKDSKEEQELKNYYQATLTTLYRMKVKDSLDRNDMPQAIQFMKKLYVLSPDDRKVADSLCYLLQKSGNTEEADIYCPPRSPAYWWGYGLGVLLGTVFMTIF